MMKYTDSDKELLTLSGWSQLILARSKQMSTSTIYVGSYRHFCLSGFALLDPAAMSEDCVVIDGQTSRSQPRSVHTNTSTWMGGKNLGHLLSPVSLDIIGQFLYYSQLYNRPFSLCQSPSVMGGNFENKVSVSTNQEYLWYIRSWPIW